MTNTSTNSRGAVGGCERGSDPTSPMRKRGEHRSFRQSRSCWNCWNLATPIRTYSPAAPEEVSNTLHHRLCLCFGGQINIQGRSTSTKTLDIDDTSPTPPSPNTSRGRYGDQRRRHTSGSSAFLPTSNRIVLGITPHSWIIQYTYIRSNNADPHRQNTSHSSG
jgi:hypothetical protein